MRKVIVELRPNMLVKGVMGGLYDTVDHIEGLEVLKLDPEKGLKIMIVEIHMMPGMTIDDLEVPGHGSIEAVLKEDGNVYTCVMRGTVPDHLRPLMQKFKLDLIWDTPMYGDKERIVISAVGDEGEIKKLLLALKVVGKVEKTSYQKAAYHPHTLLSELTPKQKEVLLTAKRVGYFEYPRKVNTEALATELGITKSTAIEHLRKAEGRIMQTILAGY